MALRPGARVTTERFGPGRVVKLTSSGAMVALDRMQGLQLEVSLRDLREETSNGRPEAVSTEAPPPTSAVAASHELPEAQRRARKSIEALRFGIVPVESIRQVTVGLEELEQWTLQYLPHNRNGRSQLSQICGAFGSGKSHTMAAIRMIAQDNTYVTAHVEVNAADVSLCDPEGVLRQLWPTTSARDLESPTPLIDLNLAAIDNGKAQAVSALANYDRVASNLSAIGTLSRLDCLDPHVEDIETFLSCGDALTASSLQNQVYADVQRRGSNWSQSPFSFKRLIGLKVGDRPADFVNCLLGYSVLARRAGYRGLVVTIDEFEVEYMLTDSKLDRLKGLVYALRTQLADEAAPLSVFIATVGQEGHIGDTIVEGVVESTDGGSYPLEAWSDAAMRELAQRIHDLYCAAYSLEASFDKRVVSSVSNALDEDDRRSSGVVRSFIKQYVARLDVMHGPGVK